MTGTCPRCGDPMPTDLNIPRSAVTQMFGMSPLPLIVTRSRTERDTDLEPDLCPPCGADEVMMDELGIPLPTRDTWPVKRQFESPPGTPPQLQTGMMCIRATTPTPSTTLAKATARPLVRRWGRAALS